MYRLWTLLRTNQSLSLSFRGPKKKKGEVQAKILSTDIVNIFKDRQDPQPRNIEEYPVFVQEFRLGDTSIHEIYVGTELLLPDKIPNQSTYSAFLRGMKRQKCKARHQYIHMDRNPDIMNEKKDINNRLMIVDLFRSTNEELKEEQRKDQQAQMQEDDDDD